MKVVEDECWICGKLIKKGEEYVDVVLRRMLKGKTAVVHRMCLKCARKRKETLSEEYYRTLVEDGIWQDDDEMEERPKRTD